MLHKKAVKPERMALLFAYPCPFCHQEAMLVQPFESMTIKCGMCHNTFAIEPVDRQTVDYIQAMLLNGRAASMPD